MKLLLREFFVCNHCRATCTNAPNCSEDLKGDLFPRKQFVECLGKHCDKPCELQQESSLKIEQLIILVKYLGNELNKLLITDPL